MLDQGDKSSDLMRAALAGDGEAYRRCLAGLAPLIRGSVMAQFRRSGSGTEDVEDVVQDTLLAIHLKRQTWNTSQPLEPWVRAIARNKVIDHLRRRGYRVHLPIDDLADVLPAAQSENEYLAHDKDRVLQALSGRQREIVSAMAVEGLTAGEAAQRFGMSEGAVRVALHRGLKFLAAKFGGGLV